MSNNAGRRTYAMEDAREKERLIQKVDADVWAQAYVVPKVDADAQILDVGCGPAALVSSVACLLPGATVIGVEQSDDRFAAATKIVEHIDNASVVQGNAYQLPLDDDQLDFAYTRFMLEYLDDPQVAISEMVRVVRVGGKVMLQDLDGQLVWHYPVDDQMQPQLEKVLASMAKAGFDPFIGRKLYSYSQLAGLKDIDIRVEPYHLYAGKIDENNSRLWELKLDIALPLMEKGLGSRVAAEDLKERFLAYLQRHDTLTYSIVFTVTGTKA